MSAICTPEVELPTLSLDSSQLSPSISSPVATITLQPAHSGGYTVTTDTQVTTLPTRAVNVARRRPLLGGPSSKILVAHCISYVMIVSASQYNAQ